eukprot:1162088-Pelagomonas_calceolata.AAC.8
MTYSLAHPIQNSGRGVNAFIGNGCGSMFLQAGDQAIETRLEDTLASNQLKLPLGERVFAPNPRS